MANLKKFTVFEHQTLIEDRSYDGVVFTKGHHLQLEAFFKEKDFPYYTLIRNGVRFCEYVGVLQLDNLLIEVLPKADNVKIVAGKTVKVSEAHLWRCMLLDMLKAVGAFNIHAPSSSSLKLKSNSLLEFYFEMFIYECELLLHRGLIKAYKKTEGNSNTLKGNIKFSKHLHLNSLHHERFYLNYTIYSVEHPLNCILYRTIRLLKSINTNKSLKARIGNLDITFPKMPAINIDEGLFKISYTRKTEPYKKAIEIARLLLLNYHPDVTKGRNDVLAIMFDMNSLWEKFVFKSLQKHNPSNYSISAQSIRPFWKSQSGSQTKMIPDIFIYDDKGINVVLDTKWKNLMGKNPSSDDLRQMYTYSKFHNNARTALIYPGDDFQELLGTFCMEKEAEVVGNFCGVLSIVAVSNISLWQMQLSENVFKSRLFTHKPCLKKDQVVSR